MSVASHLSYTQYITHTSVILVRESAAYMQIRVFAAEYAWSAPCSDMCMVLLPIVIALESCVILAAYAMLRHMYMYMYMYMPQYVHGMPRSWGAGNSRVKVTSKNRSACKLTQQVPVEVAAHAVADPSGVRSQLPEDAVRRMDLLQGSLCTLPAAKPLQPTSTFAEACRRLCDRPEYGPSHRSLAGFALDLSGRSPAKM